MSNSYNKAYIFIHVVFVVREQNALLSKSVRNVMLAHLKKMAADKAIQIKAVEGTESHLHFLLQLHPVQSVAQVIKTLKEETASWINENKLLKGFFEWEEGAVIYSVSPTSIDKVIEYISRQETFHVTKTLNEELEAFEKAIQ